MARAFLAAHLTTASTTTISANSGVILHTICINNIGTSMTVTVWDSLTASGTQVAAITAVSGSAYYLYDVTLNVGLTVVVGGTPGDVTVTYS